jgi:hypothetical protein
MTADRYNGRQIGCGISANSMLKRRVRVLPQSAGGPRASARPRPGALFAASSPPSPVRKELRGELR